MAKIIRKTHIDISQVTSKVKNLNAKVGFFSSSVYPDEETKKGETIKGQQVAYIASVQEYGAPQQGIPPRPFMRNAIDTNSQKWKKIFFKKLGEAFINGNFEAPFEAVGITAQGDIKRSIKELNRPALKTATVRARLRGKKQGKSVSLTVAKPLIDTGYMLNSVQYEVGNDR